METQFVPHTESIALKGLGFNEPCLSFYRNMKDGSMLSACNTHNDNQFSTCTNQELKNFTSDEYCSAPLYQQAFKWFRENYKSYHSIEFKHSKYYGYIQNSDFTIWCDTYEEAELECLRKLIEIYQIELNKSSKFINLKYCDLEEIFSTVGYFK